MDSHTERAIAETLFQGDGHDLRRRFPGVEWLLLLLAVAEWFVLKYWWSEQPPELLAVMVAVAMAGLAARLLWIVGRQWIRRRQWASAFAEGALIVGVLVALAAGMANWALGLQGAVILHEQESAVLHGGAELQEFVAGPLARLEEMNLALTLKSVELIPRSGGFLPRSHLELQSHGEPVQLTVSPVSSASHGSLRFYQGAFGFAPRIVIVRNEETVFDRVVPLLTDLQNAGRVSFQGRFTLESEELAFEAQIDLETLDDTMQGHATLHLNVWHQGQPLGRGDLLPGHFADLEHGYRVGFAGLKKWSEIDLSRHNYSRVVLSGAATALCSLLLWPVFMWLRW